MIIKPPIAAITPADTPVINVTAGGSVSLSASNSSCPGTPDNCTHAWSLNCTGPAPGKGVLATGDPFLVTTGTEAGRTVDTTGSSYKMCLATLTVTNAFGLIATTSASIQV